MYAIIRFENGCYYGTVKSESEMWNALFSCELVPKTDYQFTCKELGYPSTRKAWNKRFVTFAERWKEVADRAESYSVEELEEWKAFFQKYGKHYGVLLKLEEIGVV